MKSNRSSRIGAALLAIGLLVAACGGSDDDSGSGSTEGAAEQEGTEAPDEAPEEGSDEPSEQGSDEPSEQATTTLVFEADEPAEEPEDAATTGPVAGGEVIYGITTDGTGFDTTSAIPAGTLRITDALNDSLVGVDPDGNWVPNLAESLVPNDDFTQWTINLREGVHFHDGETVDAAAVVANMTAYKNSPVVGFVFAPIAEIAADGDLSVVVTMNTPWAAFPYMLIGQPGFVVSPSTIGNNDTFVGTGSFTLESWVPGDAARVVRNEDYWRADEGLPYLDAITFKVIPDQNGRKQALLAGDIDAYHGPSDSDALEFSGDDSVVVLGSTAPANEGLFILNTTAAPVDDLRIRTAMAHAIDRNLLIETFRSGLTVEANTFIEPNSPWYSATDYPAFDPETGAGLVAEYEAEIGPAEITLTVSNTPSTIEVAEVVASFWDAIGIDTTVEPIAPGTEVTPVISDDFQAIYWFQFASPDPDVDYVFFHSSAGPINWSNLVDPDIDGGFDKARASADAAVRAEGYAQVQEAMVAQLPMLWIDHLGGVDVAVSRPEIDGFQDSTFRDGTPTVGLYNGSYFTWQSVWRQS